MGNIMLYGSTNSESKVVMTNPSIYKCIKSMVQCTICVYIFVTELNHNVDRYPVLITDYQFCSET